MCAPSPSAALLAVNSSFTLCPSTNFRSFAFLVLSLSKFLFSVPKEKQTRETFAFWIRWLDDVYVLAEHFGGVAVVISQGQFRMVSPWPDAPILFLSIARAEFCFPNTPDFKAVPSALAEGLFPEDVSPCRQFQGILALDRGASCQCAAAGAAPCSLPVPWTGHGLFPGCSPHPARPLVSTAGLNPQQRRFGGSKPHPGPV